jgi:hypothetical protein
LIFDHSDLEKYYEKMPAIYGLLQKMKGLKKQKYDTVTLEILREYLEAHILLDKEFSDYSV